MGTCGLRRDGAETRQVPKYCLGEVWDRLQSCDGPFPKSLAQAHTYTHQGHVPRGKTGLWDAFGAFWWLLPLWLLGRGTWDPVWVCSCWF